MYVIISRMWKPCDFCLWLSVMIRNPHHVLEDLLFSFDTHTYIIGDYNMLYFDKSPEFDFQSTFHGCNSFAAMTYCYILNATQNGFCYIILYIRYKYNKLSDSPIMLVSLLFFINAFIQILIFGIFKFI